jgi:NADPH2:quinone reductase
MSISLRPQRFRWRTARAITRSRTAAGCSREKPVGGDYAEPAVRSMAYFGRYLVVGFTSGEIPRIPMNLPLLKGCSIVGVAWDTYSRRNPGGGQANISEMIAWIREGKLKPVVTARYALSDAPRALEEVMQRRVQGKVVIVP